MMHRAALSLRAMTGGWLLTIAAVIAGADALRAEGAANPVSVEQISVLSIAKTPAAGEGPAQEDIAAEPGNALILRQEGSGNVGDVTQSLTSLDGEGGASGRNLGLLTQTGSSNHAQVVQDGVGNAFTIEQSGDDHSTELDQRGSDLNATMDQSGYGSAVSVQQHGSSLAVDVSIQGGPGVEVRQSGHGLGAPIEIRQY